MCATALLVGSFPDRGGKFTKKGTLDLVIVNIDPRVGPGVAVVMEIILSFILVYVIFATAFDTGAHILTWRWFFSYTDSKPLLLKLTPRTP